MWLSPMLLFLPYQDDERFMMMSITVGYDGDGGELIPIVVWWLSQTWSVFSAKDIWRLLLFTIVFKSGFFFLVALAFGSRKLSQA